jgi:hypothetical protein
MAIKGTFAPIWLADMTQRVDCTAFCAGHFVSGFVKKHMLPVSHMGGDTLHD